ncbi:hypothetical protein K435DRAFT_841403, partial [Dendrothele bispora CBS 962.96]
MGAFMFTEDMVQTSYKIWIITSIVGACICFIMLVVIGLVALRPVSRHHLDRVSFRIVVYVLLTNMVFGIVSTNLVYTGPSSGWRCGFTMWIFQLTLQLSSFLTFSIALNLQLVVVHRVNGQRMEKFYVIGSCLISLCITTPPYAAGQYGWNPLSHGCWYSSRNDNEHLSWEIGSQLLWLLFTALGETIASLVVFIYIIK